MSYGSAGALQTAVYTRLAQDAALTALVGAAIYDAVPSGTLPETYVSLGVEDARTRSDASGAVTDHDLTLTVVSASAGFATAKAVAAAVSAAVEAPGLVVTAGRIMSLQFLSARARRVRDADMRRIDLRFRVRIDIN